MKAISLWQPWASLIACGLKRCETRTWVPYHRGQIAIHAAKRRSADVPDLADIIGGPDWVHWKRAAQHMGCRVDHSRRLIDFDGLPRGRIVAIAELVDVVQINAMSTPLDFQELAFGNYQTGRYRWDLHDVHCIRPIPCVGHQGLFDVEFDGPIIDCKGNIIIEEEP